MGAELDLNKCKGFAHCAVLCNVVYLNSLNLRLLMLESPVILLIIKMLYVSYRREKSFGALDIRCPRN